MLPPTDNWLVAFSFVRMLSAGLVGRNVWGQIPVESVCPCLPVYTNMCVYIPFSPVKSEDQVLKCWKSGIGLGFSKASVTFWKRGCLFWWLKWNGTLAVWLWVGCWTLLRFFALVCLSRSQSLPCKLKLCCHQVFSTMLRTQLKIKGDVSEVGHT